MFTKKVHKTTGLFSLRRPAKKRGGRMLKGFSPNAKTKVRRQWMITFDDYCFFQDKIPDKIN